MRVRRHRAPCAQALVWWLCVVCLLPLMVLHVHAQTVTLPFSASVTLVNATEGRDNYNVTADFASSIEAALNQATTWPVPLTSATYNMPPSIVVTSTAWVTDTVANANVTRRQLQAYFDAWRVNGNATLSANLTQLALQNIGRQPALVAPTTSCAYYTDAVVPLAASACLRNLTVSIFTPLVTDGATLRTLLCAILPTSCDFVVLDAVTRTSVHSPVSGLITPHTRLDYRVYARDRNVALATLLQYLQYASALSSQQITYVLVNDTQVYYSGNYTQQVVDGSIADCVSHYWYLIFLIFVLLILMVLSQRCYYIGRASGRRSARKMEQEIRAGQHMATMLQGNYGYAPLPPPGAFAYNYAPPMYEQSAMTQGAMAATMYNLQGAAPPPQQSEQTAWQ